MEHEELKTKYFDYLMDRAGLEKDGPDGYSKLCEKLMRSDFLPLIDKDGNRCCECLEMRNDFLDRMEETDCVDHGDVLVMEEGFCATGTMLEILVVLGEKMRFEMADSEYEASTRKWILEMIGNCGLDRYARNDAYDEQSVDDILYTVIFREIGWDGEGGLFPLFMAQRDQRRLELISQMNDYLEENYDI